MKYNDTDFIITECIMILKTMAKEYRESKAILDRLLVSYKEEA